MPTKKILGYLFLAILSILLYQGYYSDVSVEELKKLYANEQSKFIEIDGMQVHFRDEGKGVPIVLLHGTGSSLHTWDDWTKELVKQYRVIRMDLPAFGLTGPNSSRDYSIKSYTKFLEKFVEQLQLETFHLGGNSLGGFIAWNYTAVHPQKVHKLILVDPSGLPTNQSDPAIFKMAKTPVLNKLLLHLTPKVFIEKNLKEVYAEDAKISDELISRYHKMVLRKGNRQAFVDRAKTDFKFATTTNIEKLKSIPNSTLLIWGAQDEWIPLDNGKKMDSLMKNSQLIIMENSGHVPMEEHPQESFNILKDFLNNLEN